MNNDKCMCGEPWTKGVIHRADAPCYWPPRETTPPQEEPWVAEPMTLDRAIEHCMPIRGKAYDGSYAAPREGFRKVLKALLEADRKERAGVVVEEIAFQTAVLNEIADRFEDIDDDVKQFPDYEKDGRLLGIAAVAMSQIPRVKNLKDRWEVIKDVMK